MILIPILFTALVTYLTIKEPVPVKESSQQIRTRVIYERGGK